MSMLAFNSRFAHGGLFTARRYAYKRGLCCRPVSVCLSVRPSVTFEYCVQTAEDIVKLLSRPSISFYFLIQDTVTQYQREPLYKFGESLKALR